MTNAQKQFVIQQHNTQEGVHWDLMLEMDDCLWTWRLNVPPAEIKNKPIVAERIGDHPLRFLTYEGPVQNGTGQVKIADKGTYQIIKKTGNAILFESQGTIIKGDFALSKTPSAPFGLLQRHPNKM